MTATSTIQRPLRGSRIDSFYPIKSLPSLASLDSAFQLQEYISLLIRLDVHDVESITSVPGKQDDSEQDKEKEKDGKEAVVVDEACWIYEQLRRLAQDLSHPLITALQAECTRGTCPEMKAGEWLYLCVAHGNDGAMEQCCAIDYILHTLDSATALLNSPRAFPSRLQIPATSHRHFSSLARRLGRIFAHAYFHHREAFEQAEAESSLYARFLALTAKFDLVPQEFLVIPPRADAESVQPPRLLGAGLEPNVNAEGETYSRELNPSWSSNRETSSNDRSRSPPGLSGNESPRKIGRNRTDTMVLSEGEAAALTSPPIPPTLTGPSLASLGKDPEPTSVPFPRNAEATPATTANSDSEPEKVEASETSNAPTTLQDLFTRPQAVADDPDEPSAQVVSEEPLALEMADSPITAQDVEEEKLTVEEGQDDTRTRPSRASTITQESITSPTTKPPPLLIDDSDTNASLSDQGLIVPQIIIPTISTTSPSSPPLESPYPAEDPPELGGDDDDDIPLVLGPKPHTLSLALHPDGSLAVNDEVDGLSMISPSTTLLRAPWEADEDEEGDALKPNENDIVTLPLPGKSKFGHAHKQKEEKSPEVEEKDIVDEQAVVKVEEEVKEETDAKPEDAPPQAAVAVAESEPEPEEESQAQAGDDSFSDEQAVSKELLADTSLEAKEPEKEEEPVPAP